MRNFARSLAPLLVLVTALGMATSSTAAPPKKSAAVPKRTLPKLVLQITVDQLRGDLPLRYQDRFAARGFRYLLDHGTWYTAAHHPHSFTETIVGHTTLATGAYPSRHGMIANSWLDRLTGETVSNVETMERPLVGTDKQGASPERILSSTFSDELNLTTAGRAKVFAVSYKDRGAVPMAGHAGKAFWFSGGCFVSSTFYYTQYPTWVTEWCKAAPADFYKGKEWTLLQDRSRYVERDRENRFPANSPPENAMAILDSMKFGRSFPHRLDPDAFENLLSITPYQDELTLDFAKTLITKESLGKDAIPDYLAISFSSTDLIAHWFSHSSIEAEDNLLRLDRTLESLFAFVDREVGLANTLIVLSGDHGGTEFPERLAGLNIPTGRLTPAKLNEVVKAALDARYGADNGFVGPYQDPYFWLDDEAIAGKKANVREVEKVVTTALLTLEGVAFAIPMEQLHAVPGIDGPLLLSIQRNHHADRSGDIYVVEAQNWQIEANEDLILLQHNAPWPYDTYVPVAFAGAGVPARRVSRGVSTTDVAATLATALRTRFPSGCVGVPLTEVVDKP